MISGNIKNAFFICLSTAVLVYIFVKCYYILDNENFRRKDTEKWWKFNMFSYKDESDSLKVSVFGVQLYILLFYAVLEDLYDIFYLLREICWTLFNHLSSIMLNILSRLSSYAMFVFVLVCSVLIAYILLIRCSKKKYRRNSNVDLHVSRELVTDTSCDSDLDRSVKCRHGNRKYLKLMIKVLVGAALLSLPWEFIRLYQSAVAEKMVLMTSGTPAECIPSQMTYLQSLKSWWRSYFSWSASDVCYEYQKALLVDPLWQVTPLKVISSAFSHCIVFPLEVILGGIGRALRRFFAEIPTQWQPFMFIVLFICFVLLLVMGCGYRIHIPMLFRFEPKTRRRHKKRKKSSNLKKELENSELNHQRSNTLISRRFSKTSTL